MSDIRQSVKQSGVTPRHIQHPGKLRWRRVARGLSLARAAEAAGCSKSHLSKLEHGQDPASVDLLVRLAGVYGCEITDLMPREPDGAVA